MNLTKVPHGDEKVTVELTVKELMALSGLHFYAGHEIRISAKKKLNSVLEDAYKREALNDDGPIPYDLLN
ncbi:hypothetical protein [Paenibacillus sp. HB172176]|uniref:hypothetical protein n=1 Tax=Paenibacillus sp. HB172176 TaxID=2493690 RepID=UPI001438A95D|nr:hypothetical protein [Paenibacillus sp. HB172176]